MLKLKAGFGCFQLFLIFSFAGTALSEIRVGSCVNQTTFKTVVLLFISRKRGVVSESHAKQGPSFVTRFYCKGQGAAHVNILKSGCICMPFQNLFNTYFNQGIILGLTLVFFIGCYMFIRRRNMMRKNMEQRGQDEQALRRRGIQATVLCG